MKRPCNPDAENLICLIVGALLASAAWMAFIAAGTP
jgi:hypothetical protein